MLPFLTAYDPLGSSSGSIDPLGALQTYGVLADMLLPGVTTITSRSRYLSMLCAALANAETHGQFRGASGLRQRRQSIEPFERLWALACVAAREHGEPMAADGLRGITYAERAFQGYERSGKKVKPDFKLLKYQSRTGAVGTYWTALIGGQLVYPSTGALTAEGHDLAKQFPKPPLSAQDLRRVASLNPNVVHRVSMAFDDFVEWARECHLAGAGKSEQDLLGEALRANGCRCHIAHALREMDHGRGLPETWETADYEKLRAKLACRKQPVSQKLTEVIDAMLVTEHFHEAVLAVFQSLLWWGTQHSDQSLGDLLGKAVFRRATKRCRKQASLLCKFHRSASPAIQDAIRELVGSFASTIDRATTPEEVVDAILHRHKKVQSGKVDGGGAKRDWLTVSHEKVLRPSPRFQWNEPPPPAGGVTLTHSYRLEPFIHMLRENGVL